MEDEKLILEGKEKEIEEPEVLNSISAEQTEEERALFDPTASIEPAVTSTEEKKEPEIVEENGSFETSIKTFTQEDVDKLVGDTRIKTREKTFRYVYDRYGVKSEEEMDALVANAQRYDTQKDMYESDKHAWETERSETEGKLADMSEQIALMQSGVDADRYEDVKLILKGKGLDVTLENIEAQLESHPEWKKTEEVKPEVEEKPEEKATVKTRITALGNEPKPAAPASEEEQAEKIFRMKFH